MRDFFMIKRIRIKLNFRRKSQKKKGLKSVYSNGYKIRESKVIDKFFAATILSFKVKYKLLIRRWFLKLV